MSKRQHLNQSGIAHLGLVLFVIILAAVGFAGWRVMKNKDKESSTSTTQKQSDQEASEAVPEWPIDPKITWEATGQGGWISLPYDTEPPACPDPLVFALPTSDIDQATSVLYPGQTRLGTFEGLGGNYKPHGGFRFDKNTDNAISVVMPFNGSVFRAGRVLEKGEIQYDFDIVNACGIMIRLGHLRDLTPDFQAIADKLPPAVEGDSRTTKVIPAVPFKTGDKIATAVGFRTTKNVAFDFGIYDLRSDNEASQSAAYKADHAGTGELSFHALCWLDLFGSKDKATVKALPAGDQAAGKQSDYCK